MSHPASRPATGIGTGEGTDPMTEDTQGHSGTPTTPDEALTIVRSRYAPPDLPAFPPTTDATGRPRPAPSGGSDIVVAKDTGERRNHRRPRPPGTAEAAIALYRRHIGRAECRRHIAGADGRTPHLGA